jgi:hypothetical protein
VDLGGLLLAEVQFWQDFFDPLHHTTAPKAGAPPLGWRGRGLPQRRRRQHTAQHATQDDSKSHATLLFAANTPG